MPETSGANVASVAYVSEALCEFAEEHLEELERLAATKNASLELTGYLYFSNGRFLQCLEGPPNAIEPLMGKISEDPRHTIVATAWEYERAERRFPRWSMRRLRTSEVTEIGLEQLLADQLLLMDRVACEGLGLDTGVWRVVESVARSLHRPGKLSIPQMRIE